MKNLKILMNENNDSSYDIARLLNIAQSSAYNYVAGKTEPSIENLIKLADHYNVTVDYLIGHQTKLNLPLSSLTTEQQGLFGKIKNLSSEECLKVSGYIDGLQGKDFKSVDWEN